MYPHEIRDVIARELINAGNEGPIGPLANRIFRALSRAKVLLVDDDPTSDLHLIGADIGELRNLE